jgi:hypothetical protein
MRLKWLALLALAAPALVGGYACSTDTFGTDAGDAASEAANPLTDFCSAEATYFAHCGYDAGCSAKNLNNCGVAYSTLNPAVAAAYTSCADMNALSCAGVVAALDSNCVKTALVGYVNDGGAYPKLAADYCKWCDKTSNLITCEANFAKQGGNGYSVSLLADGVVNAVDTTCALALALADPDGGPIGSDAGTVSCSTAFSVCELVVIAGSLPSNACTDGGF